MLGYWLSERHHASDSDWKSKSQGISRKSVERKGPLAIITTTQQELLEKIGDLWKRYPHWRSGQLVANAAGWIDQEIWDGENKKLLEGVTSHLAERAQRDRQVCEVS